MMQYKFVMFQTQAISPYIFRFAMQNHSALFETSWSKKSGKTGKNAPSVIGDQRAVTLCTGVYMTNSYRPGFEKFDWLIASL